jgi:hypothetical protein
MIHNFIIINTTNLGSLEFFKCDYCGETKSVWNFKNINGGMKIHHKLSKTKYCEEHILSQVLL